MAAALPFEVMTIQGDAITPDLLVWRRYKRPAPGILEILLDSNPQLGPALAEGPFLPVGSVVLMPIDRDILAGRPSTATVVRLYGDG